MSSLERAQELLFRLDELARELAELDPMKRLELEATGGARALSQSQDWTLELVKANALVSIAASLEAIGIALVNRG